MNEASLEIQEKWQSYYPARNCLLQSPVPILVKIERKLEKEALPYTADFGIHFAFVRLRSTIRFSGRNSFKYQIFFIAIITNKKMKVLAIILALAAIAFALPIGGGVVYGGYPYLGGLGVLGGYGAGITRASAVGYGAGYGIGGIGGIGYLGGIGGLWI